jgi:hypothetical protein
MEHQANTNKISLSICISVAFYVGLSIKFIALANGVSYPDVLTFNAKAPDN